MKQPVSDALHWWQLLKQGDKLALESIYYMYIDALIRYGQKFTPNQTLVEDTIHDLFINLWNSRDRLTEVSSVNAYLYTSLRNNLIRAVAKGKNVSSQEDFSFFDFGADTSIEQSIIKEELDVELRNKMEMSLKDLTARQKEAIFLKFYEDKDYDEICEIMALNYQSARNLVASALKRIKESF